MKKLLSVFGALLLLSSTSSSAAQGFLIGGQLGYRGITGDLSTTNSNALVFGADLGLRTSSLIDLIYSFQLSSHPGLSGLSIYSNAVSADFHIGATDDFDFTVGLGPGLYIYSGTLASSTKFGLNFGGAADVAATENIWVGLGARLHTVFDGGGNLWTVTARLRFVFGS